VAEALRSQDPNLRIVFITSMPQYLVEEQAASLQPFKSVQKPCEFFDLLMAIHETLGQVPETATSV
jgi:hypothetical protein